MSASSYWDYDEMARLSPEAEERFAEAVRMIAAAHGFPLSDWQPTMPLPRASVSREGPGTA